jgi:hypothetical protein
LDKTIKELTNRLDEVHPYSASLFNNYQSNRSDGITYWKGKKIIPIKDWNQLYEKSSKYTDTYKIILTSRKPLQYFPDDYNGSISSIRVIEELNEEIQNWNKDYYELLEYRKNPTWGRMKCSNCLLSGSLDDPIFNGIEKVFARIVSNRCNDNNNNNVFNNYSNGIITYHCNVMNIFSCPFESVEESDNDIDERKELKYPFKREDLFALHQISFAIEQAITTFAEITKNNEIIFEVDFENDRVKEIHTNYYGEPESWGWHENVNEQLSKVKHISNIIIRDEQDIYNILTNRERLETLIEEYENKNNHRLANEEQQVCCDENTPCVTNKDNDDNEKIMNVDIGNYNNNANVPHKGKNCPSNKLKEESDNEKLISNLKAQIKNELAKHEKKQQILLKDNKQNIINFLVDNKDSIRVEDLKIYEPVYKCYREKGNCYICNSFANINCKNCNGNSWLCINHWQEHATENHIRQLIR